MYFSRVSTVQLPFIVFASISFRRSSSATLSKVRAWRSVSPFSIISCCSSPVSFSRRSLFAMVERAIPSFMEIFSRVISPLSISLFMAAASSKQLRSLRWIFSSKASTADLFLSASISMHGTVFSPASFAALNLRSPDISSKPFSVCLTVRGWIIPFAVMLFASDVSSSGEKCLRG